LARIVPTEDELRRWYESVWQTRRGPDIVLIKTLLYTGALPSSTSPSASAASTSTTAGSASRTAKVQGPRRAAPAVVRRSLEIYSRLALTDAQATYDNVIGRFLVRAARWLLCP
jgi:hypothetical protein